MLLVCTFYTPHVHNLGFLRTQAERIDPRLTYVWPRDTRKDRARFEKLKEAYVKARYSKHYRITKEELEWLGEQVEESPAARLNGMRAGQMRGGIGINDFLCRRICAEQ